MLQIDPLYLEDAAQTLETTGKYRVLRRVTALPPMPSAMDGIKRGIYLDVETTGLDPAFSATIWMRRGDRVRA